MHCDHAVFAVSAIFSVMLPRLLFAYWVLAAGSVVATLLPIPVPQAFKDAVRLSACRGKLWQNRPTALGPLQDWSVPQSWFLHFYVLGSLCNAAVLLLFFTSTLQWHSSGFEACEASVLLLLSVFEVHLLRRALETGLIMRCPPTAQMHGIAYLFGMSYYIVAPLSLLPAAWYQQQRWLQLLSATSLCQAQHQQVAAPAQDLSASQVIGVVVFLAGNMLQYDAHRRLAALSKRLHHRNTEQHTYKLPTGGMFEYVSCPHYLAEIIIYAGLVLISRGQLLTLLMLLWVGLNLALAAGATHEWYRKQFKQYPPQRRALVPYLY